MKKVLIVLGSPNSEKGELGRIALDRLNYCQSIFDSKEHLILCTGGFGPHFNTTSMPHAHYAIEYLINNGIKRASFMDIALSSHTVDDAVKVKEVLRDFLYPVKIITSFYHLERTKIIFDIILPNLEKEYFGVAHPDLTKNEENTLVQHESKAIAKIKENGLYF